MKIGSLKEVFLLDAREIFLFDCRAAGLDPAAVGAYRQVLGSFIHFTGDFPVKNLTADHVHFYIAQLSDGPEEGEELSDIVMAHYAMIKTWIRWLEAQRILLERVDGVLEPPRLTDLFPLRRNVTKLPMGI